MIRPETCTDKAKRVDIYVMLTLSGKTTVSLKDATCNHRLIVTGLPCRSNVITRAARNLSPKGL